MLKVQTVASAPVYFACCDGGFPLENWSGREDSNLRPLPPEGVAPRSHPIAASNFPWEQNSTGAGTLRHIFPMNLILSLRPLSIWRLYG
jgi:hypothetical protein